VIKRVSSFDQIIFFTAITLLLIGIVMVYSSSTIIAAENFHDPYFFLKKDILWVILGIACILFFMNFDYKLLRKYIYPLLFISFFLLILVLVPDLGKEVGGAKRWLKLGFFSFQPSELAKLVLIIYMSHSLVKKEDYLDNFSMGYLPNLLILGIFSLLIIFQPDLGTAVLIASVIFFLFIIAGVRYSYLLYSFLMILPFLFTAISNVGYRKRRILAFLDPWSDPFDAGFQIIQSFLALGKGGLIGLGLGQGEQKLFYLPEPHTDFIFAVIGEELGFIGAMIIIALFLFLFLKGIKVAKGCSDPFGKYLAFGIIMMITLQVIINIGVVVGLLPTKGLPLPFISMGGSSLIINSVGIGILLNISKRVAKE
jgi:cell division protein FtsW